MERDVSTGLAGDAPTVFVSPRLRCRHWVATDRDALLRVYGDADAMRWVGDGSVLSEAEADLWLEITARNYARRGYGMFALDDRTTGELVGFIGLVHPGDQPEVEVKYALERAWWGRGVATEAVRHLLDAAASRYGVREVIATVAPEHAASQRVLAKSGMTRRADRVGADGGRTRVYARVWTSVHDRVVPSVQDPHRVVVPERIETPRLLLRPFSIADAPALHEALVESLTALREHLWFLPWVAEPPTLASAEARCVQAAENFRQRTDLAYLAFDRRSGRLVASAGLHRTDWALPATEVGVWVRTSEMGKGYATEAVTALTAWALDTLGAERVAFVADAINAGSRAVALRCGFELEGVRRRAARSPDGQLRDLCLYARYPNRVGSHDSLS